MLNLWMRASVFITLVVVILMLGFLVSQSWPYWWQYGIGMLFAGEWYPYERLFGMAPAIIGSFWAAVVALIIAIPTGIAAAVMSTELMSGPWRGLLRGGMELLAGIPSVVYGLLGLWVLLPFLQSSLNLLTGHNLLAAGLLLSVMVLPTIMVMAQDALHEVHINQREAALSLGIDWNTRLWRVLLPQAWPGIRSGILLALGRALGETMAVMLVVGSMDRIPDPWYNLLAPAQTLTSRIGREIGEATFGSIHFAALMACGLLLAVATIAISLLAQEKRGQFTFFPGEAGSRKK
ncbi:MAG: phosphate ABC transporter permease subunit PstC [Mariprofundaceae bacterium]|nr:phosphate ABC transporter permease subunit PstC [Mariprofundaceae bacterium]